MLRHLKEVNLVIPSFQVNSLLPGETFVQVVSGLLGNSVATVRRKAMELLNNKLMNQKDYFTEDQVRHFRR